MIAHPISPPRSARVALAIRHSLPVRRPTGFDVAADHRPRRTRRLRVTWPSLGVSVIWCLLVGGALAATLDSLRTEDLDGLNNMIQIPFALPWFLVPVGGIWSYETDAWIAAGMGWFNGLLILVLTPAWFQRRRPPSAT